MKSCPTCKRTFEDTLTYCLVDGSILSAPFDPQATLALPQQNPTVPMMNPAATNPVTAPAVKSNKLLWITLASVALIVAGAIVVILLINHQSSSSESVSNGAGQNQTQVNETNINNRNDNSQPASKTVTENKKTANENTANDNAQSGTETEDLRSLHKYSGQYANDMFKNEAGLRERLKSLLGPNYKLFMERWDVTSPIEDDGNILFAEGCMAHACTSDESLLAIDTSKGIIYCAVLSDSLGGKFKTYSEGNNSLQPVMKNKIQEIMGLK